MRDTSAGDGPFPIVVLASGEGTNLQAIIDALHGGDAVEVAGVASDKRGCRALQRAADAGIATETFPAGDFAGDRGARDAAMAGWIEQRGARLVVLAGYMQLLSPSFIQRFEHRVINVHPSLLPAFPGLGAIEQAVAAGVAETGVTVHFVDEGVDTGPVVAQRKVPVEQPVDVDVLTARIHAIEHELLPQAILDFAAGRIAP